MKRNSDDEEEVKNIEEEKEQEKLLPVDMMINYDDKDGESGGLLLGSRSQTQSTMVSSTADGLES